MFPAKSLHVADSRIVPSPEEVLDVVQFAGSIPEPPTSSPQFQVTFTSLAFQPALFTAGTCVGDAVGGIVSGGLFAVPSKR